MRCAQCYRPVKPVIVCDIDGTLGDYHTHFGNFVRVYWNLPQYEVPPQWDGSGEFEEFLGITKVQYREAKLAYRQGGNKRSLPIYEGVKQALDSFRERGAEVWIATTRPWQRLDNIDPDTREWLRRNDLTVDGLLFGDDKYRQISEAVDPSSIVAVIEDLPEQYDIASGLGLPVMLRENHHNRFMLYEKDWVSGTLDQCWVWAGQRLKTWQARNEKIGFQ